jgi:hypothetical protein
VRKSVVFILNMLFQETTDNHMILKVERNEAKRRVPSNEKADNHNPFPFVNKSF